MIHTPILETIWLLAPAALANMAPVFAARYHWLPQFNLPVDYGLEWHGRRLLGDNKTIRGFVVGGLTAALVGSLQSSVIQGTVIGLGALLSDAAFSFVKRRLNISPGASWIPFDQIDFVIGALIAAWFFVPLTTPHIIFSIIIFGLGSYLVSAIGVTLGIKKSL